MFSMSLFITVMVNFPHQPEQPLHPQCTHSTIFPWKIKSKLEVINSGKFGSKTKVLTVYNYFIPFCAVDDPIHCCPGHSASSNTLG